MVTPTNQIVLTYKDGRTISIVQTAEGVHPAGSKYGHSVEVWIDGHEEPNINLNAENFIKYLQDNMKEKQQPKDYADETI
jgi:hypothetical protein